ncbi:MAG: M28 family peptidase, partial [Salinimicrobium sp.]
MRKISFLGILFLFPVLLNSCVETKDLHENAEVTGAKEDYSKGIPFENVISKEDLAQAVKYLASDELKGRQTGTEGIEKAAEFIEDALKNSHIKPFFRTYRDSFEVGGMTGYNIVGLKEGTDSRLKNEIIIIGAHYDHLGRANTVGTDSLANGANDNASGPAAVLELMKYFAGVDSKRSILFSFFSAEELGLV